MSIFAGPFVRGLGDLSDGDAGFALFGPFSGKEVLRKVDLWAGPTGTVSVALLPCKLGIYVFEPGAVPALSEAGFSVGRPLCVGTTPVNQVSLHTVNVIIPIDSSKHFGFGFGLPLRAGARVGVVLVNDGESQNVTGTTGIVVDALGGVSVHVPSHGKKGGQVTN